MKTVDYIYAIIITLMAASGCRKDLVGLEYHHYESDTYVVQYVSYDDIELKQFYDEEFDRWFDDWHTAFMVIGVMDGNGCDAISDEENNKAEHKTKCAEINDFGYKYESSTTTSGYNHTQWYNDAVSINITSDMDYDAEHPAGISLNDVFNLVSMSPYKFIQSGYKKKFAFHETDLSSLPEYLLHFKGKLITNTWMNDKTLHPVYGLVSDLTPEDMKLMGGYQECSREKGNKKCYFILCPAKDPEVNKIHNITVEIKDMYGKTFSDSIQITF